MGKIKKILENELVGGTQSTDVYPVTSIKAVYDENNERLDNILKRRGTVNISTNYNDDHTAEVLTLAQAIAKVPSADRVLGFSGTFLSADGWVTYRFDGESIADWTDTTKWSLMADSNTLKQEVGTDPKVGMSQKAVTGAIAAEIARAKAAEEANAAAIEAEVEKLSELESKMDKQGIYDVSANNNGAIFESLSALLNNTNLSTLIPTSVRCGGMSIRFVRSSDNKYVQYRLMSDTFNTAVANWQGVDDEPTAGSENLVKSGGINAAFEDVIGVKAVNENVAASSIWESGSFNANLEEVASESKVRTKIDLTDYQGCEIKFHAYGYAGFIMPDATVNNVKNYNSPFTSSPLITLTVPNGASYFCITTAKDESQFTRYALFTRDEKKGKIKKIAEEVVQSATKDADTIALDNTQLVCKATNVQAAFEEYHVDKNYTINKVIEIPVTANTAVTRNDTEVLFDTVYKAGSDCFFWLYPTQELSQWAYTQITFIKEDGTTFPQGLLNFAEKRKYTLAFNIIGYYFTFTASQIVNTGKIKYGFYIEKDIRSLTTDTINNNESVEMGRLAYQYQNNSNIKDISGILSGLRSVIIGGANDKIRCVRNIWNYPAYFPNVFVVDDSFLNSQNLSRIDGNTAQVASGGTLTFSKFLYNTDGDIFSIIDNTPEFTYYRFEFYVYSAHKDFPTTSSIQFQGYGITKNTSTILDTPSEFVKLVRCEGYTVSSTKASGYLFLKIDAAATSVYSAGEFGITGLKLAFLANNELNKNIVGDWEIEAINFPILKEDIFSEQGINNLRNNIYSGYNGFSWNRVEEIREYLSMFILRYKNKAVDEYNRVLVSFNGDSIIGSQLDDIDHAEGYNTGDFPPNMSKNIIARMFFDRYRYADEDTIFRNLEHSDWVKQGFNISKGKDDSSKTFNEIEVYGCQEGDYAQIEVTGYSFFKLVWSEYDVAYNSRLYSFNVLRSTDNGETFEQIDSISVNSDRRLMVAYKIYKINPSTSYIFKIVPTSGYAYVCLWGCEMWNNPRLDVVVEAFSGTDTAGVLANKLDGYYSEYHKPALIITDILAINDYAVNPNINLWIENSAKLSNKIKEKGTLLLPMTTNGGNFVNYGYSLWKSLGYNVIDIASKLKDQRFNEFKSVINATDGLHLSNYGNSYFFEELKRVFDGVLLT